jgi:hypothetical protein
VLVGASSGLELVTGGGGGALAVIGASGAGDIAITGSAAAVLSALVGSGAGLSYIANIAGSGGGALASLGASGAAYNSSATLIAAGRIALEKAPSAIVALDAAPAGRITIEGLESMYTVGSTIAFKTTFSWLALATWVYSIGDPSSVTVAIRAPSGAVSHLSLAGGDVTRLSLGVFACQFVPSETGTHFVSVTASLSGVTATSPNAAFQVVAHVI